MLNILQPGLISSTNKPRTKRLFTAEPAVAYPAGSLTVRRAAKPLQIVLIHPFIYDNPAMGVLV